MSQRDRVRDMCESERECFVGECVCVCVCVNDVLKDRCTYVSRERERERER